MTGGSGNPETGVIGWLIEGAARWYSVPPGTAGPLLAAGAMLGVAADILLRAPDPPGVNLSIWIASVAAAAVILHRWRSMPLDRERAAWLVIGAAFAAGLAWRDAVPLRLLALGCATLAFAIAAHRGAAVWVRRAGLLRYVGALALGTLHVWTAGALALRDAARAAPPAGADRAARWRRAAAIARGLAIATPLVAAFGALLTSADAVFAGFVSDVLRVDFEWIAGHAALFLIGAWISTGYLHGFLTGTDLPWGAAAGEAPARRGPLGITEAATALGAVNLLFLTFVIVQFRYLFGGDTIVQITPDLTYAEYARRGFFELVVAVALVVPVLLAADWLLDRRGRLDVLVFCSLAGVQVGLVLAIAASALQRLRLYYESYGLTESRFYAMALLLWIGAMLVWLAATVLRGRRDLFAFGALASGFGAVAVLFAANPDAIVARANVARMASASIPVRFDVAYVASLSADAVPVLIEALPRLPPHVQCPLARHLLQRWPPDRDRSIRGWNWSAARASGAVREHETRLRSMMGPNQACAAPGAG